MANKKNVEANKKNTEIKNKKSNELEQKKPTKKKKLRLHSHLKVNIPLFQSLMMILPSLAKHAAAEDIDSSGDTADQLAANSVTEKDVSDDHGRTDSSAVTHQEAQTSDSDVNSTLSASHAAHGSSSHLVPSHHLSTLSHPQVHYIPSVSMPTISSGSNGQPTHSNAPTTPALPVTFMPEVIKGTYGELHVDANGQYTFVLNPKSPQYILLNQHQQGTDHFLLHLSNGSSVIVQVPVTGKQDTPSISGDLTGVVTEDHNIDSQGLLHANGKIDVIDPDQNESSVTPEVISGKYGSLTIDSDGHWQYQVDNSLSNVQALTGATSLHESFTIHTKDGTPQTIDMTIGGNDDNAVITGVDAGTVTEDLTTQVQGQLSVTDSDLGEDHFQASQVTSNFGTLSITKDGAWTYSLDNNNPVVQRLGQGSTATDIVTVHSADGTAHQVMVTINGTNDHAVITSSTANSPSSFFAIGTSNGSSQVTEDKELTVSGQLNITDIDSKEAHFSNSDLKGTLGTLHLKDNGDWTYDLDNKNPHVQALGQGSATTDIITIHSADGTPHQIAITVNGTNDKAVISGTSAGAVTEESQLQTSGTLAVTDVDTGEAHFATSSTGSTDIAGSFGTLHLTDTGSWTYDLDNSNPNVQALGKGATATDTITIHSADGTPHQVTITVNGTNDKAIVSSATVAIDETDIAVTTSGTLTSTDVDNPDNAFTPDSIGGTNGNLTIDANGHWVFTANSAFNQLNVGDKVDETFTVSSVDGTPSTIKVTINGTNDAATVSSATVAIDETDKAVTTSGTLTSTDMDNPDNTFTPDSISGTNGDLAVDASGHWVFTANSAFNQLNIGDKVEETFTVSSVDGTSSTIKVTINGTNDKAVISGTSTGVVTEESQLKTSGSLTVTDVDAGQAHFSNTDIAGTLGTLHLTNSGTWTYDLDNTNPTVQALGKGTTATDTITVHSADGTPHQITITVNGTNDAAVITGTTTGNVDEGHGSFGDMSPDYAQPGLVKLGQAGLSADGKLDIVDPDTGESQFDSKGGAWNNSYHGQYGHLILNPDGTWHYHVTVGSVDWVSHRNTTVGTTIDELGENQTLTDTITVYSKDGTSHDIVITIHGDNDRPYISSEVTLSTGTEDTALTFTKADLLANTVDVDANDAGKLSIANLLVDHGSVVDNKDGTYTFTPTKDYNGQVHFTYDVTDAHGGITATGANLHLQATGDAATITGIDQGNVTEDRGYIDTQYNLHFDGKLDIVDPDQGEAQFDIQRGHTYHGIGYDTKMGGWVLLQQDGTYTYTIDNRKPEIQNLGSTETLVDKVTIHSVDGTSHEIQITIHGTNDDPKVSSVTTLPAGTEDTDVVLHASDLLANATDIDHNDAGQLSVANLTADHGKITDNHDGTFTFHPALDYNGKVSFSYDVKDAHAGSTATSASMTLAPTSDAAVITGSGSGVKEDINVDISSGHLLGASGVFHVVDPDGPAQSQFPDVLYGGIYQGSHGGDLQVNSNGNYYYHMSNYLVQHLSEGEILKEEYTIHSVDGTQHKVEFTVEGTNDKPVLTAQTQSITEGGTLLSGQMHATDVDTKDTHTFTIDKAVDGLTFNNDGSYTFDPSHASYQNLGANNDQVIHVQVKVDDHNGGTDTKTLTLVVHGTNDSATIGGQDTFTVQEDHNLTLNSGNTIIYNGQLTITDADAGEDHFDGNLHQNQQTGTWDTGYTTQEGGKLILQSNGSYRYEIDNSLAKIQSLGSSETLIDTVTVRSADGTPHQIQVTIQGDNDAPVVSSAVTLTAGTEDIDVVLHASDLLANATDIDHNDAGKLSVANLIADHGKITDNHDGTFTFHPNQDYNGKVSFTYDVQDAHGGSVATSASITLTPTRDSAVISGNDAGTIIEDHNVGHSSAQKIAISGSLSVTDPDTGEDHFRFNQFGEKAIHDPFGGDLRITPAGSWGYEVSNSRLQSLAEGEVEKVVYRVYSADHTAHDITITVTGTNDQPTIIATTLAHGTEDTHYQMQASQFGFNDIDSGDTLHSMAITDLPPATQGEFLLDGHDVTAGQQIPTADISKLQFVPAQDFNGDVQFKYTVNDGHTDSQEATNTLHIDAVGDKAVISGVDTGDVYENRNPDMSPDFAQPGMAHLTNSMIHVEGQLTIIDPDTGENSFDSKGIGYTYHGKYGHLILNTDGKWFYGVATGTADVNGGLTTNVGSTIDQLGANETLTDTITIQSKDGTTHDIVITIHGDNDRPYCNSEVQLNSGKEDTQVSLTTQELLANTVDVDANDLGKLTIANLHADHGSIQDNKDGTYTFTPTKDYNGQVHFSYDVKDAHGGVAHTGASTTLAAVDDKTIISGIDHGVATEDIATHMSTNANIMDAVDWQALQVTDVDSPNTQVTVEFAGKQYTWNIGSNLDVTTPYGKFQFHTIASGSHKGEHSWSYIGDNNNVHVQELKHGESLTESIKLIATDGTEFPITVKVNGTEDGVVIDSNSELGHVVENAQTGASVSGNVVAHDVDLHDTVSWTQTPTGGISGQYGTFHLSADGQWHYDVDQSKATKLGDGDEYWEHFTVEAVSTDGSHVSKSVSVVVHGNNDVPTVSGEVSLPSGKEDTSIHITQAELIANATDVDTNDRGWLHVENLTADHGSLVSNSDGSFTFNPDPNYNGTVHFTYDVADRHGGIAHTRANTSLVAVNDAATFTDDSGSISEDTNIHHNLHTTGSATIPDALFCHGHLIVSDADGHGEAALDLKGQQKISLDGTYGHFDITSSGRWVYKADNNSVPIQDLDNGQTLTDSIEVTSKDGTKHSITVTINGTTDAPTLHSLSDSGVQHNGPVEGNLLTGSGTDQGLSGAATDTDSNAHLVLQDIQIKDPVSGYVAVRPGQPHTMAGIGTLAIEANGHYTFTPEVGFTGKVPSMVYRVGDDGGNPIGDSSQNSLSIEVTPPLQHTPTVTGQTVSTNEDITRTITTSEFGYSDQDGDALQFVTISSIPSHGLLLLNGNAVTANQQISKADLDAGHLTFTPINNENGANYAQFTFTANDGHKNSASATMVVDVNAVNDAPIVGSSFISSLEDKPHAFTTADFKYSDIDGDALNHITITNVAHGVLSLNGATVNVGDDVSASDVSSLIFTPTHNYFSSGVSGLGGVQFTANDGHLDSKEGSILINIASVADPATFSGDSTGVAKEDITLQASGTLTASDPDGTAGFTAVQGGAGIAGSKGYGHAHIDVNGHWTYDLDNNHPIVQQLGEGQTDTETITVQSADGTHHDIVVTITGTNDAPILGVNQTSSTTGTLTETDVDVTDSHTFSVVSSAGQFGSLSVDPNTGDYVYTPNTSITGMSYNSATNSYHGVDVFEVKVSDGHTDDSKFITFDASGHVTMSPTGGLVISTTVPQQPTVTTTLPTVQMVTNVATTNSVTLDLASTSDSGSSSTDNLTNDTTPTITGHTDIPFSKVTIYDGSTPVGHSVSDASGQYSVSVSSLSDGDHNLSAKALAPSSVMSATSSPLSVHIDTQVHVGIQTDPITADNVINAQESNSSIDITGSVSGDFNTGDIVTLDVNGTQHTGVVDAKGHYSIAVPGSELIADADQKIEASVAVTDTAGNSAHATADLTYQVDTQVSVPTITFENAGSDNLYSKAEIARGHANTITATVTPPGDAKIGEHLVVNGQDHVLDAHTLQHGIQIEVHPGSNVQATMTDEHGNTAGSQGFAASAIPEPIIVRPPSGSHQVSGTLGVPPLLPSLTPVPTAQSGWRIHLPNGQYVTSHHGQYGTLTIDPQTGHLHYQEQAQVHTGPHGSASGIGQHEDKFEVALQGTNQDEVVAHVNIQILSHGPGHSGKLTVGTEVVDMTITPLVHTSHPAPPPPPPVQHDEPDMASQADFTVTLSDDSNLDLTQQTHQEPDQKTSHHGAAAYLDALGIKPDATSTTVHDQPADMDIVLAQVDQPDAVTHDQAHLDMSDALEHHDANINHNQDDEHHHHNDVDGLPDIDPNS
ncbi:VCBS repeat protein [Vibrio coralliirubri]|uniref:VCBS domain-containing protein n=1 Tax=Vibrio coralliirubri TaxID=1516159 RepID=UPI0006317F84|nr:VCBS domain-containing protein [Vibrio coralliirubri]CDU06008.1 VCBS repeat protein [Vibrio coralliirubri]